jgi:hypothetical protein
LIAVVSSLCDTISPQECTRQQFPGEEAFSSYVNANTSLALQVQFPTTLKALVEPTSSVTLDVAVLPFTNFTKTVTPLIRVVKSSSVTTFAAVAAATS